MADISGFHTFINDGSHGQGDQSLKENFQDHEKGVRNDAFLNSLTWARRVLSIKNLLSLLFKKTAPLEGIPGCYRTAVLFSYYYRGNYF